MAPDEVVVVDAGVKINDLGDAGIERFVVRLAKNFTAQRNEEAPYQGVGRPPVYGKTVRPLKANRLPQHRRIGSKSGS